MISAAVVKGRTACAVIKGEPPAAAVTKGGAGPLNPLVVSFLARSEVAALAAETAESGAEAAEAGTIAALAGVSLSNATLNAATRALLAALDHTLGLPAYLTEAGREGLFKWNGANLSTQVAADPQQGIYVPPTGGNGSTGAWVRVIGSPLRPEWYGAVGDGLINDTVAFQSLAARMNALGGGVVELNPVATYVVGLQDNHASAPTNSDGTGSGVFRYTAQDILHLVNCDGVVIRGNGAKLLIAPNLRHGSFNADGTAMASSNGYTGVGAASAYGVAVYLESCDNIQASDFTIIGNSSNTNKGGPWGDTGYQIGGTGIQLNDCTRYVISNVESRDNLSDNWQIAGPCSGLGSPDEEGTLLNCRGLTCGRNSLSLIGGKGLRFVGCDFSFAGKASETGATDFHLFKSSPGACIDVEAEGAREVHVINFIGCRIACSWGAAFLYAGGGASNLHFTDCIFIADSGAALYNGAILSGAKFTRCRIIGCSLWQGTAGVGGEPAVWDECTFLDNASESPTGQVYDTGTILDLGGNNAGVLFNNTRFALTGSATIPSAAAGAIYRNTTVIQANPALTGIGDVIFEGRNDWAIPNPDVGEINIQSSNLQKYRGVFYLNGAEVSVQGVLHNFHGARIRGYDGTNQHTYRLGMWSNPVDWAAQVGGANVGDVVISTVNADGGGSFWQCKTAPGTAGMTQWRPLGIKGLAPLATIGALSPGDTPDVIGARFNALLAAMQAGFLMQ